MGDRIWELPGPSSFIRDIVQDLKDGINVVIHITKFNFFNFDEYLRNFINEEANWYELKPTVKDENPLNFLVRTFLSEKNSQINTLQELVNVIDSMKFLWLDFNLLSEEEKLKWILFLKEYIKICDQKDRFSRLVFCFNVSENLHQKEFNSAFLKEHFFFDYLSDLDFIKAIHDSLPMHNFDYITGNIIQSLIFELSFPNYDLAFHLAERVDKLVAFDTELIKEYIEARKISFDKNFLRNINSLSKPKYIRCSHPLYEYWLNNLIMFNDETITTSALNYYCRGEKHHIFIKQLIWKAQIKTLFPLLEHYRIRLIEYIKITHKVKELISANILNEVEEIYELELGSLFHYIVAENRILLPQSTKELLITLREIRNDISHLRVISQNKIGKLKSLISDFDKEFSTISN